MKRVLLYCLLWLLPMASLGAPTVLVVGDSLSAGYGVSADQRWVTLLQKRLHARCGEVRVINASVSGDTSSGGVTRLPPLLKQHHPALVIIELGGNDGLRGINTRSMRSNLLDMVRGAQRTGSRVLLLGMKLPANYGPDFVNAFHQVYYDVAEAASVPLVPFFLESVALDPDLMQADGIHPNDRAQPILLDTMWPHLDPMLDDPGSGFDCHDPAVKPVSAL
ncbi:MAG: arylesterase [Candidatus Thiodiazotropha sp.]|jgi:acyl-CoA thioesterase I